MMETARPDPSVCVAAARSTSDSVMAPTPERTTRTLTASVESLVSVLFNTSTEPCTSALTMSSSSLTSRSPRASMPRLVVCKSVFCREIIWRWCEICCAFVISATTWKASPACGTP